MRYVFKLNLCVRICIENYSNCSPLFTVLPFHLSPPLLSPPPPLPTISLPPPLPLTFPSSLPHHPNPPSVTSCPDGVQHYLIVTEAKTKRVTIDGNNFFTNLPELIEVSAAVKHADRLRLLPTCVQTYRQLLSLTTGQPFCHTYIRTYIFTVHLCIYTHVCTYINMNVYWTELL